MNDFENSLFSFLFMVFGLITSFTDAFEQWARIIAAILTAIVAMINIYKFARSIKK